MADLAYPNNIQTLPRQGLKPLAWLPNKCGFSFIGRFRDGSEQQCLVLWDNRENLHRVNFMGTVREYGDLIGWRDA